MEAIRSEDTKAKIRASRSATKARRQTQVCRVFELKVSIRHNPKETFKKPGEWKTKSQVTDEALRATAEYMMGKIEKGHEAYEITWTNRATGKKIVLICKVIKPHP